MDLISAGIQGLNELLKRYNHSCITLFFKKRKSNFVYIPIGLNDFLMNTRISSDKINIIVLENVINQLLPELELSTFNKCLSKYYDNENYEKEPYFSIIRKTLKRVIEEFLCITNTSKKLLFLTRDIKLFQLINSKNKFNMIPMLEIINKNVHEMTPEQRENVYKSIIDISYTETDEMYKCYAFRSIDELDKIVNRLLKVKVKK